jgi:N-acetylglutamate synthase-like GNAT family acetyltransferase
MPVRRQEHVPARTHVPANILAKWIPVMIARHALALPPRLVARALRAGEHGVLAAALTKSGLPVDDLEAAGHLFWRFETKDDIPLGFGGLEIYGDDALLRSVVTLPPVREGGIGSAIVAALEAEAQLRGARTIWLLTTSAGGFFKRLGYVVCDRAVVPDAIRATREFSDLCPATADVLVKRPRLTGASVR